MAVYGKELHEKRKTYNDFVKLHNELTDIIESKGHNIKLPYMTGVIYFKPLEVNPKIFINFLD